MLVCVAKNKGSPVSDYLLILFYTTLWNAWFSLVICGILWSNIFVDCLRQSIFFTVHSNQYFMSVYFLGVKNPFRMIHDPFTCFILDLFCHYNWLAGYLLCITNKSKSPCPSLSKNSIIPYGFTDWDVNQASPLFTLIVLRPIGTGTV